MKNILFLTLLHILFISSYAQTTAVQPIGQGIESDPYQIANLANLRWVSETSSSWDKFFELTADIDAADTTFWNSGNGFTPIGNISNEFTGKFRNPHRYRINNLVVNRGSSLYQGLFGVTSGALITDLALENLSIHAQSYAGGIVGFAINTTIQQCYTSGNISVDDNSAGGIIGGNNSSGDNYTIIQSSYSEANIHAGNQAGGLVGNNEGSLALQDCYSKGAVLTTENFIGGLIGWTTHRLILRRCYAIGSINSDCNYKGGLIGFVYIRFINPIVEDNYFDIDTTGVPASKGIGNILNHTGVTGKHTTDMLTFPSFNNWFSVNTWKIYYKLYPRFKWEVFVEEFVVRLYIYTQRRHSYTSDEINYWSDQLKDRSKSGAEVAREFFDSDKFRNKYFHDEAFVSVLYVIFFDRVPDTGGYNNWLNQLNNGMSRTEVVESFIRSTEFSNLAGVYEINVFSDVERFVIRFYQQCLNREPEITDREYWVSHLINQTEAGAGLAICFSQEFLGRNISNKEYIKILYRAFFNRDPDADGYNNWLSQLNTGTSRQDVLNGFLDSAEFFALCESYGILARLQN